LLIKTSKPPTSHNKMKLTLAQVIMGLLSSNPKPNIQKAFSKPKTKVILDDEGTTQLLDEFLVMLALNMDELHSKRSDSNSKLLKGDIFEPSSENTIEGKKAHTFVEHNAAVAAPAKYLNLIVGVYDLTRERNLTTEKALHPDDRYWYDPESDRLYQYCYNCSGHGQSSDADSWGYYWSMFYSGGASQYDAYLAKQRIQYFQLKLDMARKIKPETRTAWKMTII
jgi:hypothetical protein